VFNVNVFGCMHFVKCASAYMLRNKVESGSIVIIGSIVGLDGNPGQCIYSASKSALVGFTKSLAQELGPRNIRVNLIAPGFIDTKLTKGSCYLSISCILSLACFRCH
jgi:NAD(P)-dependent dehydrogenase (short-subunit alcohol dehydrogenase family)